MLSYKISDKKFYYLENEMVIKGNIIFEFLLKKKLFLMV